MSKTSWLKTDAVGEWANRLCGRRQQHKNVRRLTKSVGDPRCWWSQKVGEEDERPLEVESRGLGSGGSREPGRAQNFSGPVQGAASLWSSGCSVPGGAEGRVCALHNQKLTADTSTSSCISTRSARGILTLQLRWVAAWPAQPMTPLLFRGADLIRARCKGGGFVTSGPLASLPIFACGRVMQSSKSLSA